MRSFDISRWSIPFRVATTLVLASGCTSSRMYRNSPGSFAFGKGVECGPQDSTESCCLKQHPGDYARCAAMPPTAPQPAKRPPPLVRSPDEDEEKKEQEEKEKRCLDYYSRCIEEIGGKPGSVYGTTQCRDCFVYCSRHGFWPARMNKKKCPGA